MCGIFMFSLCLFGFSLSSPASSQSPKIWIVTGFVCVCVPWVCVCVSVRCVCPDLWTADFRHNWQISTLYPQVVLLLTSGWTHTCWQALSGYLASSNSFFFSFFLFHGTVCSVICSEETRSRCSWFLLDPMLIFMFVCLNDKILAIILTHMWAKM